MVRLDNSFASYENAASKHGFTVVTALSGGVKLTPNVGVVARLTSAQDSPPVGNGGLILANPVLGGVYGVTIGDVRLAGSLAFTLPVGGGGGSSPGPGALDARSSGAPARMAMDNSIFAVNDFALIPGVDAAYVSHGLTVQVEATLFQLWRVRGGAVQHEAAKTNFTSGLHVGYFVLPVLSFGADLRYQHWLNPPFGAPGVDIAASDPRIDQVSIAVGPRAHFHLGRTFWLRPGVAYSRGLDKPLGGATPNYHVVQVDIPFAF